MEEYHNQYLTANNINQLIASNIDIVILNFAKKNIIAKYKEMNLQLCPLIKY